MKKIMIVLLATFMAIFTLVISDINIIDTGNFLKPTKEAEAAGGTVPGPSAVAPDRYV